MYLWCLPSEIVEVNNYKYIIDIIDIFSKWIWPYPFYNKISESALDVLKNLFLVLVNPIRFIQTTMLNLKIKILENFFINNNIKYKFSKSFISKSAGAIEAVHNQI